MGLPTDPLGTPPGQWHTENEKTPPLPLKLTSASGTPSLLLDVDAIQDTILLNAASPGWLVTLPKPIRDSLQFRQSHDFPLPKPPIIIILYAGPDDASSLESAIHAVAPWLT
jgi:hypothetical protein